MKEEARDPTAVLLTNRNFGDINLNGIDVHLVYYLNRHWNLGANYSFYDKNFFAKSASQPRDITLNAPKHKFGAVLNYRNAQVGVDGNLRLRFIDRFPVNTGVYRGDVDRYTVLDLSLGYNLPFASDTRFALAVQNLTNNRHREVVGAPEIGRLAILRLTQSF